MRQPFLGHLPPLSSTNRYTRVFHLRIDISPRSGAGLWNGSSSSGGSWPLNSHPWWIESSHEYARYFYFVSGTRVCVCGTIRATDTLFFFSFSLRYSRASPPRYITFVWSFFGLSNGFATLRGVHSARKETWCSRKSRKSRKSGSLYFVQRVGSTIL